MKKKVFKLRDGGRRQAGVAYMSISVTKMSPAGYSIASTPLSELKKYILCKQSRWLGIKAGNFLEEKSKFCSTI